MSDNHSCILLVPTHLGSVLGIGIYELTILLNYLCYQGSTNMNALAQVSAQFKVNIVISC